MPGLSMLLTSVGTESFGEHKADIRAKEEHDFTKDRESI